MFCHNYMMVEKPETSLPFPPHQSSISISHWESQLVAPAAQRPLLPFPPEWAGGLLEPRQEERACRGASTAQGPRCAPWESISHPTTSFQPFYADYFLYSFMQILPTERDAWKCICHTPSAGSAISSSHQPLDTPGPAPFGDVNTILLGHCWDAGELAPRYPLFTSSQQTGC